ncbi:hypothetical protein CV102_15245 [Natronococcus pandeyae]|uniref:Uncharacterized protein n=1 Tax=Natronococcus pandeyae TaxID=2055836 RepID=A0A8J8PZG9_9EURY|nr:hypothetical protein [Natronococcus pandeyae]TYL37691.1 hypothetical protein CV102_15245 [Natronococcus pandeyae]
MTGRERFAADDRAVSITVTHVLTIGITTILIAMLLIAGSSVLEAQTDRSVDSSLETVGERLANEIDNADRMGDNGADNVRVTAEHPRTVSNTGYTVELREECDGPLLDGETDCVRLSATDVDVVVYVPLAEDVEIDGESSVSGGTIEIVYDDSDGIRLEEAD